MVHLARTLPDLSGLEAAPRSGEVVLLDRNGRTIARRGEVSQEAIQAEDLPQNLVDAVWRWRTGAFYGHFGVDLIGTDPRRLGQSARRPGGAGRLDNHPAIGQESLPDVRAHLYPQGQEMMLALWLERRFTKDEILALYLNRVYFGAGAWGAEAASRRYFGKAADQLSIGEAALLAGLLKAPSRYAPTNDATRASVRATVVLDLMLASGRITEAERIDAAQKSRSGSRAAPPAPARAGSPIGSMPQVRELSGGHEGDLIVRTTLDVNAQRAAEAAAAPWPVNTPDWSRGATRRRLDRAGRRGRRRSHGRRIGL
jgi:penicillin-binding protein 1A